MNVHFVYMWYDRARKMFYVGSHTGRLDDGYISSSRWLTGEVRYRPQDFRRRIVKIFPTRQEAQHVEYSLIHLIKETWFGIKYYNLKQGKPKGCAAWNKGVPRTPLARERQSATKRQRAIPPWNKGVPMSEDAKENLSIVKRGKKAWNVGVANPLSADNGRRGADKLRNYAMGRRRYVKEDGGWTWAYKRDDDTWYIRDRITNKKWKEVSIDAHLLS